MAVEISVTYSGELHCAAEHGPSGDRLVTDAPVDNQGRGEAFSPTDLVATAMGTCMLTIMGIYANREGLDIRGARARVSKEMSASTPRRISRIEVRIDMPTPLSEKHQRGMEAAAHTCPVHQSLHPETETVLNLQWASS